MTTNDVRVWIRMKDNPYNRKMMENYGYTDKHGLKAQVYDIVVYLIDKEDKKRICSMLTECNIEHIVDVE